MSTDTRGSMPPVRTDWVPGRDRTVGQLLQRFRPGFEVEVRTTDERGRSVRRTLLIGHVNELMGTCDDCVAARPDDIVLRYRQVWRPGA